MMTKLPELWLKYATDDIQSAKILLREGIYNMVCFHSQQAVEKLFKSLIAAHHQEIPRTHNLIRLYAICEDLFGSKLNIDDECLIFLNDVYIDSRYPADFGIMPLGQPGKEEAEKAHNYANDIDELLRPIIKKLVKK